MCVYICVYRYICIYICVCIYIHLYIYRFRFHYRYIPAIYMCVCIYMCIYMCVCMYIYMFRFHYRYIPAMWETQVWSFSQEDPLEEDMPTRSSILSWRIPWTGEPGGLQTVVSQRVGHDWATNTHVGIYHIFWPIQSDGQLEYFHCWTIINNTINMGVWVFLWDPTSGSFKQITGSGIAESYGSAIFNF